MINVVGSSQLRLMPTPENAFAGSHLASTQLAIDEYVCYLYLIVL